MEHAEFASKGKAVSARLADATNKVTGIGKSLYLYIDEKAIVFIHSL
jgi:hypothetical protein